jgi:2-polyprenyl-3-methyl-5-hydroxy-6-metoxy-1,4-benzoquinol methylase
MAIIKSIQKKYGFELPFVSDPLVKIAIRYCKGNTLLDIGCGEGADSVFWAKHGFNVTAIDSNEQYLKRLHAYCEDAGISNIHIVHTNAGHYHYPPDHFDVISSILMICCMRKSQVETILPKIKQSVKRGGIVVMSARNYMDPEYHDYLQTGKQVEPNTFTTHKDCCQFVYFIEKGQLLEYFSDFEVLYYYEGVTTCKYQEHLRHGDSMIIARRKQ